MIRVQRLLAGAAGLITPAGCVQRFTEVKDAISVRRILGSFVDDAAPDPDESQEVPDQKLATGQHQVAGLKDPIQTA